MISLFVPISLFFILMITLHQLLLPKEYSKYIFSSHQTLPFAFWFFKHFTLGASNIRKSSRPSFQNTIIATAYNLTSSVKMPDGSIPMRKNEKEAERKIVGTQQFVDQQSIDKQHLILERIDKPLIEWPLLFKERQHILDERRHGPEQLLLEGKKIFPEFRRVNEYLDHFLEDSEILLGDMEVFIRKYQAKKQDLEERRNRAVGVKREIDLRAESLVAQCKQFEKEMKQEEGGVAAKEKDDAVEKLNSKEASNYEEAECGGFEIVTPEQSQEDQI